MATNAGLSADLVTRDISSSDITEYHGVNFSNGHVVDMLESGIIDPAKVTRCALKNAVSVVGTLLLTKHGIVDF